MSQHSPTRLLRYRQGSIDVNDACVRATELRPGRPGAGLKHPAAVPTHKAVSVSSGVRPTGAVFGASALPAALDDAQEALVAELVAFMTRDTPSVQHVLDLATPHLRVAAGLTAATVFELDSETGLLNECAQLGEPGRRDRLTAGKV